MHRGMKISREPLPLNTFCGLEVSEDAVKVMSDRRVSPQKKNGLLKVQETQPHGSGWGGPASC